MNYNKKDSRSNKDLARFDNRNPHSTQYEQYNPYYFGSTNPNSNNLSPHRNYLQTNIDSRLFNNHTPRSNNQPNNLRINPTNTYFGDSNPPGIHRANSYGNNNPPKK